MTSDECIILGTVLTGLGLILLTATQIFLHQWLEAFKHS